jgi:hypothetical protein
MNGASAAQKTYNRLLTGRPTILQSQSRQSPSRWQSTLRTEQLCHSAVLSALQKPVTISKTMSSRQQPCMYTCTHARLYISCTTPASLCKRSESKVSNQICRSQPARRILNQQQSKSVKASYHGNYIKPVTYLQSRREPCHVIIIIIQPYHVTQLRRPNDERKIAASGTLVYSIHTELWCNI